MRTKRISLFVCAALFALANTSVFSQSTCPLHEFTALLPSGALSGAAAGQSVAISGDYALVGAPCANGTLKRDPAAG
jgi:hypothetical protein